MANYFSRGLKKCVEVLPLHHAKNFGEQLKDLLGFPTRPTTAPETAPIPSTPPIDPKLLRRPTTSPLRIVVDDPSRCVARGGRGVTCGRRTAASVCLGLILLCGLISQVMRMSVANDGGTNGRYLNWERLEQGNSRFEAKIRHEESTPENKRTKGIGLGARPEGPISLDDFRSLQRSNADSLSTNGTYLNHERSLKQGNTRFEAKLRHSDDIIPVAVPPQHDQALAFVYREVVSSMPSSDHLLASEVAGNWAADERQALINTSGMTAPDIKKQFGNAVIRNSGEMNTEIPVSDDSDFLSTNGTYLNRERSLKRENTRFEAKLHYTDDIIPVAAPPQHEESTPENRRPKGIRLGARPEGLISLNDFRSLQRLNAEMEELKDSISKPYLAQLNALNESFKTAKSKLTEANEIIKSTNGTYLNCERSLKRGNSRFKAKLCHSDDIVPVAVPLQHVASYMSSIPSSNANVLKRKAEESTPENKRRKGIGLGARPEGPISLDDFRSLQRSNADSLHQWHISQSREELEAREH